MSELKLTKQEWQVTNYLIGKNNGKVFWEELAQFAKDPQNVKRKTVLKIISEIKKKYLIVGALVPFNVNFGSLTSEPEIKEPLQIAIPVNLPIQNLVQIKRTPAGNM